MKKLSVAPYSVVFFLLACIVTFFLAITATMWLRYANYFFGLFLSFAIVVGLIKVGNLKLGGEQAPMRCSAALFIVLALALQLGCYLLFSYFAMAVVLLTPQAIDAIELGRQINDLAWFFLPFYALLGCAIGHYQGCDRLQPTFYHMLGISGHTAAARAISAFIRQALLFAVILPVGFAIALLSEQLAAALQWPFHTGWRLWIMLPLLFIPALPSWRRLTHYLWVKHVPLGVQLLLLLIAYTGLIALVNRLTENIGNNVPDFLSAHSAAVLKYQAMIQPLQAMGRLGLSHIIALAWAPLIAFIIAYLARGQRIYTVILSLCGLPVGLWLLGHPNFVANLIVPTATGGMIFTAMFLSLLLLLLSFTKFFEKALLATMAQVKASPRRRLPFRIMHGLLYACSVIAVLQITGGVITVYLLAFTLVAPCALIFFSLIMRFLLNANKKAIPQK